MKKRILAALLILTMCLGLSACGSSTSGSEDSKADKKDEDTSKEKEKKHPKNMASAIRGR